MNEETKEKDAMQEEQMKTDSTRVKHITIAAILLPIVLKLLGVIDCSWWWVFSPMLAFVAFVTVTTNYAMYKVGFFKKMREARKRVKERKKNGETAEGQTKKPPLIVGIPAKIIRYGTLLLVALKLLDVIDWSWWWIVGPYVAMFVYNAHVVAIFIFKHIESRDEQQ